MEQSVKRLDDSRLHPCGRVDQRGGREGRHHLLGPSPRHPLEVLAEFQVVKGEAR